MEWWEILLVVSGAISAFFISLITLTWVLRSSFARRNYEIIRQMERMERDRGLFWPDDGLEITKASKKRSFLAQGPRTFYFLDEQAVNELHSQVVKEAQPVEVVTEQKESKTGGIGARLPFVGSALQRATGTAVRQRYIPEENLGDRYNRVETSFLENDQVTLQIEDFIKREPSSEEFRSMCEQMDERFKITIPKDVQEKYIQQQREAIACEKLKELREARGYVLMRGVFIVTSEDDNWLLLYMHPLNENLLCQDKGATVRCSLRKQETTPSGTSTFSCSPNVNVTLLGKVVYWDEDDWTLRLNPIAVY